MTCVTYRVYRNSNREDDWDVKGENQPTRSRKKRFGVSKRDDDLYVKVQG
jgi:hypothetical protein